MRAAFATSLVLAAVLAGCLGGETPIQEPSMVESPDWAVRGIYGELDPELTDHLHPPDDHDHVNASHHLDMSSPNVQMLGHAPLATDYHDAPSGGYYCGGTGHDGARKLAVVNSFTSNTAAVIVDVTDPEQPRKLGEFILERAHIYDSAMTPDAQYVVLATSPLEAIAESDPNEAGLPPLPPATPATATATTAGGAGIVWRDACGETHILQGREQQLPLNSGVVLLDVSDPTDPTFADYQPTPALGPHSVDASEVHGENFVVASTTNLVYQASYVNIYTVIETPLGPRLQPAASHDAHYDYGGQPAVDDAGPGEAAGSAIDLLNGHVDATLQEHPNGEAIFYFSNWGGGLQILRLDGPAQLTPLSVWGEHDPDQGSQMTGNIHGALPLPEMWNDRHVTIVGQEVGGRPEGRPTGQVVLLDTTDPADPRPLARWTLPVDIAQWSGLSFSTHYSAFDMEREILYTAMYHGGVWAADARPQHWPELPSLAAFVPARPDVEPVTKTLFPEVLDVFTLGGGNVLAFDAGSGAHVFRVERDPDVPLAAPWMEDAWIGE